MPAIVDKLRTGKEFDRRRSLNNEEREAVKLNYKNGYSIHLLAKIFGVSRRLIQFILFPERYERNKEIPRGKYKQTKEQRRLTMQEHRNYKKQLLKQGKIK